MCDEITSALDPELKSEVLAVLEDLKRDGLTLILVTHEIGFARRAADRVVVLAEGQDHRRRPAQPGARRSADAADAAVPQPDADLTLRRRPLSLWERRTKCPLSLRERAG